MLQAFYMDKQYRRALTLLKGSDLIEQDVRFRYLAAKCLVECKEWEECLAMVGGWEEDSLESIDMQVCSSNAAGTPTYKVFHLAVRSGGRTTDKLQQHLSSDSV